MKPSREARGPAAASHQLLASEAIEGAASAAAQSYIDAQDNGALLVAPRAPTMLAVCSHSVAPRARLALKPGLWGN